MKSTASYEELCRATAALQLFELSDDRKADMLTGASLVIAKAFDMGIGDASRQKIMSDVKKWIGI